MRTWRGYIWVISLYSGGLFIKQEIFEQDIAMKIGIPDLLCLLRRLWYSS